MILSKFTPCNFFSIWEPRWRDRVVLLAKHKVGTHNKVVFTKAKSMGTDPYYVSGAVVKKCKLEDNGAIPCYAVAIDKLEPLEINERDIREVF